MATRKSQWITINEKENFKGGVIFHKNGQLKKIWFEKNGKPDGVHLSFHPNGNLAMK